MIEDILNEVEKRVERIRWKDYQKRRKYIERARRRKMLKKLKRSYYDDLYDDFEEW